jgi:nucleotide-binding universal stress UspA family protein
MAPENGTPTVVAYDGSDGARAAIAAVARLVPDRPAIVMSVWRSLAEAAPASLIAIPADVARESYERLDRGAEKQAADLSEEGAQALSELGVEATSTAVRSEWNTWSSIVDFADRSDAALVVVGSRGLSGVKSALLGSVSNGVVHHCRRPVLVVHPGETTVPDPD